MSASVIEKPVEYLRALVSRASTVISEISLWRKHIMADVEQIKTDIAALQQAQAAASAELGELANMVETLQAGTVTQDQLDALHDRLAAVTSSLVSSVQDAEIQSGQPHPEQQQ